MKILTLTFIMLASLAYGQTAYRFINPQYGVKDHREWMPESLYTNCVLWMTMNNDPTKLSSWGVPDGSWSRNNGTQDNADYRPAWTNGWFLFDGVSDHFTTPSSINVGASGFAVSFWVNIKTITAASSWHMLVASYPGSGTTNFYCGIFNNAGVSQVVLTAYYQTTASTVRSLPNIPTNTWAHYIITSKTGSETKIYINGVETTYSVQTVGVGSYKYANTPTYIGKWFGGLPLNGSMDNVMIFNRAPTATEVATLYNIVKAAHL